MKILIPPSEGKSNVNTDVVNFESTNYKFYNEVKDVLNILSKVPISDIKKIYGTTDYQSIWRKKWGFDYSVSKCVFGGDSFINKNHIINKVIVRISKLIQYDFVSSLKTVARKGYSSQYGKNNNLLDDFYAHDPKNGPLKYFDI